ncbi:Oxygen-independent coproporphyrinogen-III oxidase-like protein YqeR [Fundidesulfovibrio magnetotacticus]|uniref:Heme chaperone HemW n=1 Tax=Fundidesulfovibrio magnetotacticus TaxID=2730080 RepID=A0A6V8LPY9_9BACT|nr:radical SAM family heme chaperone HemW [Fundidesulfovibrio magnetotacticus]GFK92418.1 Oxygen-independent coproporphyrinogen-III oxidase-like protein YqeR [Fundidesulfovibrio magnetotacticus]
MLLYVHVPFCAAKCRYCAFASQPLDMDALESWGRAVAAEAAHYGRILGRPEVETVYLGGGTPSLMPAWAFDRLMESLKRHFNIPADIEFTLEANPDSARDTDLMRLWREAGVNRVSLGVQSLQGEELALLGRPHTLADVHTAVQRLRAQGLPNLSVDLIWGLPGQRLRFWMENLKAAVRLGPDHISAYGLTLEPGTPLAEAVEAGAMAPVGEDEAARMYVQGGDFLEEQGFLHYEISNFARMGFASRHNQGYWEGKDYLGLGPSAVSTLQGRRWENPRAVSDYVQAARDKAWGRDAETLDPQVRARELLMLALRTSRGMRLADYRRLTGRDLAGTEAKLLGALRQKDLIRIKDGTLRLTRQGMLVSNLIIGRFLFP